MGAHWPGKLEYGLMVNIQRRIIFYPKRVPTGPGRLYRRISRPFTKNDIKTTRGAMDTANLQKLIDLMSKELWRDPDIECHACDGVAWVIKQFDANGKVLKSSGDLDYIYGQRTLEEIARCLPSDDQIYDAPALVAVSQKNGTNNFV